MSHPVYSHSTTLKLTCAGAALSVLLVGHGVAIQSTTAKELHADFRPLLSSFPLRGPILVEVTFTNRAEQSKELKLGANSKEAYEFNIIDPRGERLTTTWRHEGGVFDIGEHELAPGAQYSQVLVLNDWYVFDQVGVYDISARVVPASEKEGGSEVLAKNFAIKVEEDLKSLVTLCSELAKRAMATDVEDAALAASALSYVEDPVCVPFMEDALEKGRPLAGILEGLGRIGTRAAVDILERFLRKSDLSAYLGAAHALRKVAEDTEDEQIRRRIETLLEEVRLPEIRIEPPVGYDE